MMCITYLLVLLVFIIFSNCFSFQQHLNPRMRMILGSSLKDSFLSIARSNNPLVKDKQLIDELLDKLCASASKSETSSLNDLGTWKICYAPHIQMLQRVLFTTFEVYYNFIDSSQLESNVFYSSKIFGEGWLNTKGTFLVQDSVCSITWDNIWWDLNTQQRGPSECDERNRHILPGIIQSIGTRAFIKEFSQFPVVHWADDLVLFQFPLTSTRIVASRLPRCPW